MIAGLNEFSETALGHMWTPMLQACALGLIAYLASIVLRKAAPSIRHWCWWIVLLRLCIPWSPESTIGLGQSERVYAEVFERTGLGTVVEVPPTTVAASTPTPQQSISTAAIILGTWSTVSLLLLSLILLRWVKLSRTISGLRGHTDPSFKDLLAACANEAGLTEFPTLLVSSGDSPIQSPCAAGILKPSIILPQPFLEKATREEVRAVMLHELIHIRRRDVLWNLIQIVLQSLFFFHPIAWLANRAIRNERELICDDEVMRIIGANRRSYCKGILRSTSPAANAFPMLPALNETRTELGRRLLRIMKTKTPKQTSILAATSFAIALAAAFALVADEPNQLAPVSATGRSEVAKSQTVSDEKPSSNEVVGEMLNDQFQAIEEIVKANSKSGIDSFATRLVKLSVIGPEGQRFKGHYTADGVTNSVRSVAPTSMQFLAEDVTFEFEREGGEGEFRVIMYVNNLARTSTTSGKQPGVRGTLKYDASPYSEAYWAEGFGNPPTSPQTELDQ